MKIKSDQDAQAAYDAHPEEFTYAEMMLADEFDRMMYGAGHSLPRYDADGWEITKISRRKSPRKGKPTEK